MIVLLLLGGLVALVVGAEGFVRGASRIAALLGVPPLIIGLTVVSIGTSTPEIAISLRGALAGSDDIALGNVVGSNIFNVLFILGLSALLVPLTVARQLVRVDVPVMIGLSLLVALLAADGRIGRIDGTLLIGCGLVYLIHLVRSARREPDLETSGSEPRGAGSWVRSGAQLVVGLVLLVLGCRWFVDGAVSAASALGVPELVIGLTVVAVGTSLPEVATSVIAGLRGERDIAVGNVVGSNIFNLILVVGISSSIAPAGLGVSPELLRFDLPVMVAVALACLPIFLSDHRIDRWEGGLLLTYYVLYTAWLVLSAMGLLPWANTWLATTAFVAPLLVATAIALRGRRPPPG